MKDLTSRQRQVLAIIIRSVQDRGFPPALQEIADTLDFRGIGAAQDHVYALERKGCLIYDVGRARGIRILLKGYQEAGIKPSPPAIQFYRYDEDARYFVRIPA